MQVKQSNSSSKCVFMINKIIVAGGNGFLGTELSSYFRDKAKEIVVFVRKPMRSASGVRYVLWDGTHQGEWSEELNNTDVLINLAGKNVNCRYTQKNKKLIYSSRLESTHALGMAIAKSKNPPKLWINASSATIYEASYTTLMTEQNGTTGDDFSMDVCKKWEAAFEQYSDLPLRRATLRTSIVLGRNGGALTPLVNLVRAGLGGKQGDGKQFCSWVHINDFCRAVEWIICNEAAKGVYNVTAPNPLPNVDFMKTLRKIKHVPVGLNLPKGLLEFGSLIIRTQSELVLKSRKVYPKRLLDAGFVFEFSDVKSALEDLCQNPRKIS